MAERDKIDIPEGRFPSNSYSSIRQGAKAKPVEEEASKAIKGSSQVKKKTIGEKIADAFIATDGKDIKDYFLFDVLVPGLKRGIEDLIHMLLYNDKKGGRVARSRGESTVRRVGYNSIYSDRRDNEAALTSQMRSGYSDLTYDTREDAEEILSMIDDRIEDAGFATLKYLNSISGMPSDFTQSNWGWRSTAGTKIYQVRSGRWLLKMPRLEEL